MFLKTTELTHGRIDFMLANTPYRPGLAQPTPHDIAPHTNHISSFVVRSFLLQTNGPPESPSHASMEPL